MSFNAIRKSYMSFLGGYVQRDQRLMNYNSTAWKTYNYLSILAFVLKLKLKMKYSFRALLSVVGASVALSGCSLLGGGGKPTASNPGQMSTATGLAFNDEDAGGFMVTPFEGQPEAPNMVFIEGGRAVMGSFEEDVMSYRDNVERTISVASFYMDETEIANIHWLEYLHHLADSAQETYNAALPDTNVWVGKLAFNDPYVDHYFRYPGFRYFPVVGISWSQASKYAAWRTLAVNRKLAE